MNRRLFLKSSGIAMFGTGAAPAWLSRAAYAEDRPGSRSKVLIAVFQRGAVDGMSMVAPFGEKSYYELRPNLAIPKPDGTRESAIDLDGFFGLHPALAPLQPLYAEGQLAIVQAAGSPDPTRSHFDAQDYMESGTPGRKGTGDGWMNRALSGSQPVKSPVRAVSLGTTLSRTLRGQNEAIAISNLRDFQVRDAGGSQTFESMYAATLDKVMNGAGRETFEAVRLMQSLQKQTYTPAAGVTYPAGRFGQSLRQIAQLIKADVGLEVAFTDGGGWDTHVNQIAARATEGQLARLLTDFGAGLAAFHRDMGDRMADILLVTMSEFGRTARENGTRGTDHGHANAMFVLGGGVRGGKVYGEWPGLEADRLYEGRDLAVTTDFRDVLGELVERHLGNADVGHVFPGYTHLKYRGLLKGMGG
jgi:uncharacterized protein (DUF1501 family)